MKCIVLGAGAGGGLPQWNCGCQNCVDARAGRIKPMTQSSVAVSADGESWLILNASPDIREQVQRTPELYPQQIRHSPIEAVALTNGDIDHIAGLLTLREKTPFTVYASGDILQILETNSVFKVLDAELAEKQMLALDQPFSPASGLTVTAFSVPGKVALFLEGDEVSLEEVGERTVGLIIETEETRLAYLPGCAALPDWVLERIAAADMLLFDGTVWENDDMQRTGTGQKTGRRMGHIPMTGAGGSLERLADFGGRKIYIHINNTNPVLQPEGPERARLTAEGWELAYDGMVL